MIITTYCCDKCDHRQSVSEQMWRVRVQYQHEGSRGDERFWSSEEQMWCRTCLENAGLVAISAKRAVPETPAPPSFEDLIRDIVRAEVTILTGAA